MRHFWDIDRFWPFNGSHPARDPTWGQLRTGKTQNFWNFHAKLHLPVDGIQFLWRFGPPKGQNTRKFWLSAPILSCRKLSWENWVLRGPINSKFKISGGVGKKTRRPFQWASLHLIWTPGRPSNRPLNVRYPSGTCALHVREFCLFWPVRPEKYSFDLGYLFGHVNHGFLCNFHGSKILLLSLITSRSFLNVNGKYLMHG